MPVKLKDSAVAVVGKKMFIVGGWDEGATNITLIFDLDTKSWARGPEMSQKRISPCAVAMKGFVIVSGGTPTGNENEEDATSGLRTVEMLDPSQDKWSSLPAMNTARSRHACGLYRDPETGNDRLIVAGGSNKEGTAGKSVESLETSDMSKGWSDMAMLNVDRCCWPQMGILGEEVLVVGGEKEASDSVEAWQRGRGMWEDSEIKMDGKRSRARAVIVQENAFPDCLKMKDDMEVKNNGTKMEEKKNSTNETLEIESTTTFH